MKIHIHIGVHKTATTYIQRRLRISQTKLNKVGIGYLPVWKFRSSFWKQFMTLDPATFKLEAHLKEFFPAGSPAGSRGILISEENLIGQCGYLVNTGKPFHGARARLSHLRKLFAGHEITLFCAVRSYDTFLSSAYCEGIRTNKAYVPFDVFRDRVDWSLMNWTKLTEKFEECLAPARTVLWQYEQFAANAEPILQTMAFGEFLAPDRKTDDAPVYSSLSQTAVAAIDCVANQLGHEVAGRLVRPIGEALLKSEGFPNFDPWSEAEKRELTRQYDIDCGKIDPHKWLIPIGGAPARSKVA